MTQKRTTRTVTDSERTLWSTVMSNVSRRGRAPSHRTPSSKQNTKQTIDFEVLQASQERPANNPSPPRTVLESRPTLSVLPDLEVGKNGGTDRRTADRLRRGRLAIDMRIDLHGLTLEMAYRRLVVFLHAAQSDGARCVLVITGKGSRTPRGLGLLREAVPRWLNEMALRSLVLSVSHARPKDGGEGALYILIRKPKAHRP